MYGVVVGRPVGPLTAGQSPGCEHECARQPDVVRLDRRHRLHRETQQRLGRTLLADRDQHGDRIPRYERSELQTYYYVVSAVGFFAEGSNSVQVAATPKLAPENLVAIGGTNQVSLSWTALSGASRLYGQARWRKRRALHQPCRRVGNHQLRG
jgi:hypothetical protein